MARLRKLTEDRTKTRQISAYDEDWAAIKRAAKQAGLTISQFLISSVMNARQPANPCPSDPDKGLAKIAPAHPVVQGKLCPR